MLWAWLALGVSSVLAVYSVPTMAYGVAVAFVVVVVAGRGLRGRLRGVLITGAAATAVGALLYCPRGVMRGGASRPITASRAWATSSTSSSGYWEQWTDALPLPIAILLVLAFVCGLAVQRRVAREPVPLAVVAIAVTLVAVIALPQSPFPRTYLYLLPIVLLTAGTGLTHGGFCGRRATTVSCGYGKRSDRRRDLRSSGRRVRIEGR